MSNLGPRAALEGFEEVVLIRAGEFHLGLAAIGLGEALFEQEVVNTERFPLGEGVDAHKDSAVFIEISRLHLDDLALNEGGEDLLHLLPKLLGLALAALGSVHPTHAESEARGHPVEIEHCLYRIPISHLDHFGQEDAMVERELCSIFHCYQCVVLLLG